MLIINIIIIYYVKHIAHTDDFPRATRLVDVTRTLRSFDG